MNDFKIIPTKIYQALPVAIIAFCLRGGRGRNINMLRIYLYLNLRNTGKGFKITATIKKQMAADLGMEVQTINKWLRKDLAEQKWVRKRASDGMVFVSGYKDVFRRLPGDLQMIRATVSVDADIRHAPEKKFKAWMIGAFISDLVRYMNYLSYNGKLSEYEELQGRNFKRSFPKENSASQFWWAISATMIMNRMGVGKATAIAYRQLAKDYGFIVIKPIRWSIDGQEYLRRKWEGGKAFAMIHTDANGRMSIDQTHEITMGAYEFRRITKQGLRA